MRMRTFLTLVATLLLGGASLATATARTPEASPVASPAGGGWAVTDMRQIAVDGAPVALSPDGQWLAGTTDDGNAVCAGRVKSLTEKLIEACARFS